MIFSVRVSSREKVSDTIRWAKIADNYDFWGFWVSNDLFKRSSWIVLSGIAKETERIRLGTAVVNPYSENPAEIAMHAATLDEYSGGRFVLGLGAGSRRWVSLAGIKQRNPLKAVEETVLIVRSLLDGKRTHFNGNIFRDWSEEAYLRFQPLRKKIPIYIGGSGSKMTELIGKIGDGGLPMTVPPETIPLINDTIVKGAVSAKRDASTIDVAACVWGAISNDSQRCRREIKTSIA